MVTHRAVTSSVGQALPWLVAAFLVLAASVLIAGWLNNTAENADQDTLNRGADAVQSDVEEQVRILELAGTGTLSLAGQSVEDLDLARMVSAIDITILTSLLDVVQYPVDENGVGQGEAILPELQSGFDLVGVELPAIDLPFEEFERLASRGQAFFSPPFATNDPDRLDYFVAIPVSDELGHHLVGVVFRPDRMIEAAAEAAGENQYAVDVIDTRFDDQLVVSVGEAARSLEAHRSPEGIETALELVVRPAEEFRFAQSPWVGGLVVGTGVLVALLLVWMGKMAKSRSEELTERLRLAHELNDSKDRFLATVSHELRTPLTVVLGVAEEVGPSWEVLGERERHELMEMMTEQALEASHIVEDLLVAARSDPAQLRLAMENTSVLPHVHYAIKSLPAESRSGVSVHVGDHSVYADTTRLRQILRNLLENAVRYGGDEITVNSHSNGDGLSVFVSDNGTDISEHDLERIFEPYEQSSTNSAGVPGVGIGLYVSRMLAQRMSGDLDCIRDNGLTTFRLTLPTSKPAA